MASHGETVRLRLGTTTELVHPHGSTGTTAAFDGRPNATFDRPSLLLQAVVEPLEDELRGTPEVGRQEVVQLAM